MAEGFIALLLVTAGVFFYLDIKKGSKDSVENEHLKDTLSNVKKSNKAITRARGDKSISSELLERYNIK